MFRSLISVLFREIRLYRKTKNYFIKKPLGMLLLMLLKDHWELRMDVRPESLQDEWAQ